MAGRVLVKIDNRTRAAPNTPRAVHRARLLPINTNFWFIGSCSHSCSGSFGQIDVRMSEENAEPAFAEAAARQAPNAQWKKAHLLTQYAGFAAKISGMITCRAAEAS